jgi:hypothetical protein
MYSNSSFNFNQTPAGSQPQFNAVTDGGTSFGYPMAPTTFGTMQMQQPMMGTQQQMPQMPQMPSQAQQTLPTGTAPVDFDLLPSTPVMDIEFTQGYLKTQIGKRVKIEFLIGTNMLIDREGTLTDVGISYIIIQEVDTDDLLLCDIYSIKFVRFYF